MKKGLLFLLVIMVSLQSFAQISVWKDTVYYNGFPKNDMLAYKVDTIYNPSNVDSLHLSWSLVNQNLLTGWASVGICDWVSCYLFDGTSHDASLGPNGKGVFYVDMKAAPTAADGCSYATIRLNQKGTGNNKDIVFKYCAWPSSTKDIDASNFVTIYPNPSSNFVNISINNTRIANLNVLNVVGRKVAHFDINSSTPNPIRVALDNVANGVYLLQFTDAAGKQIGVRRFTKN